VRYFLVTSPGYTATKWFAWSLARHPAVYCNHSAGSERLTGDYDAVELARLAEEKLGQRDRQPLDAFFERLAGVSGAATVAGNVHRYNLSALNRNLERFGAARPFDAVNLVRHPLPWVASGARQLARAFQGSPRVRSRLRSHQQCHAAMYRTLGAPPSLDAEELAFCYLCGRLPQLVAEVRDPSIRHVRMEDLTTKAWVWSDVTRQLTGLELAVTDAHVRQVFARGPIHRHRDDGRTPTRVGDDWPAWRRRVFRHWVERSGIVGAYRALGYDVDEATRRWSTPRSDASTPPSEDRRAAELPMASPCSAGLLRHAAAPCLEEVRAGAVKLGWMLEPGMARTLRRLHRELDRAGLAALARGRTTSLMSLGVPHGAAPWPAEEGWSEDADWQATAYHPLMHDRSPAVVFRQAATGEQLVLNLKGGGLRSRLHSFVVRDDRFPGYQALLAGGGHKPIDILVDHDDDEWASHTLLGAALLLPSYFELRHALGWHRLLYAVDGAPAATCVPVRLALPHEVARAGPQGVTREPLSEYLTDPEHMSPRQLSQLARDVHPLALLRRPWLLASVVRLRVAQQRGRQPSAAVRRDLATLYRSEKGPVIYEHVTRAKLRVGHLWALMTSDELVVEQQLERGWQPSPDHARRLVLTVAEAIYRAHGRELLQPPGAFADCGSTRGRFELLAALHRAQPESAGDIMWRVGRTGGRSLGALHGAHGHGLGRRIKLPRAGAAAPRDRYGLVERIGSPGGGSCAKRNMTVSGEWVDDVHMFNPLMDPLSLAARVANRLSPGTFRWASREQVATLQRCDLELAEESMTMFAAIMLGDPSLVPEAHLRIDALRAERRRLEDRLGSAARENRAELVTRIEALERELGRERRRAPALGTNPCLEAFQSAYRSYYAEGRVSARRAPRGWHWLAGPP
jgi:hypothetical protein